MFRGQHYFPPLAARKTIAKPRKLHRRITDERYVGAAKALYNEEGILEVDDGAQVSRGEEGAYVRSGQ